jgi:hypothetical protein
MVALEKCAEWLRHLEALTGLVDVRCIRPVGENNQTAFHVGKVRVQHEDFWANAHRRRFHTALYSLESPVWGYIGGRTLESEESFAKGWTVVPSGIH